VRYPRVIIRAASSAAIAITFCPESGCHDTAIAFVSSPLQRKSAMSGESSVSTTLQGRIEDHWDDPAPWVEDVPNDLEALQGVWYSFGGRREAEMLVSGTHFAVRFSDGDIYIGDFELDLICTPRTMAMRVHEGPARHKGKTALCIYELAAGALHWCAASPGRTERLTAFPAQDAAEYLFLVFRRTLSE
jgi:uncharacterized protein (TIGR03067 family)